MKLLLVCTLTCGHRLGTPQSHHQPQTILPSCAQQLKEKRSKDGFNYVNFYVKNAYIFQVSLQVALGRSFYQQQPF